jgi:hypothetical protein
MIGPSGFLGGDPKGACRDRSRVPLSRRDGCRAQGGLPDFRIALRGLEAGAPFTPIIDPWGDR